jgi:transposase InsO family protein
MPYIVQPWHLIVAALAGWVNQQQKQQIEFLLATIEILKERQGRRRIFLNDDQRRRLAVKAKVLGRKLLAEVSTVFSPETILRWHRELVARKWDHSEKRKSPGRPPISDDVKQLVLQFSRENPTWGYDRIAGALANLHYSISDESVGNILREQGIEPAPKRTTASTWKTFLKAHWDVLAAVDFTTIEVWSRNGLITFYLLFVMNLKSRCVEFAGCSCSPDSSYMRQIARNLTWADEGFLNGCRYLLMDRDGKFCESFHEIIRQAKVSPVRLPPQSPNLNAHIERFMRSIKSECLDRMIFFSERQLCRAVGEYLAHYHCERNHQGLSNQLIEPLPKTESRSAPVVRRRRLGGLLNYYHRAAA